MRSILGLASAGAAQARILVSILAAGLVAVALSPADAAKRTVQVPDRYDGHWTIEAVSTAGPCASSTRYDVRIKDSDASIPGDDVDIAGGVSAGGAVRATIVKGSIRVPITGRLDSRGTGSGTWRSTGDSPFACSGNWSARRTG